MYDGNELAFFFFAAAAAAADAYCAADKRCNPLCSLSRKQDIFSPSLHALEVDAGKCLFPVIQFDRELVKHAVRH